MPAAARAAEAGAAATAGMAKARAGRAAYLGGTDLSGHPRCRRPGRRRRVPGAGLSMSSDPTCARTRSRPAVPLRADAALTFIGTIRTPWTSREDCPKQGAPDGPECRLLIEPPWDAALDGIEAFASLEVLYWLHRARRDLVLQNPGHADAVRGTFALRSPVRPNPIGTAMVRLVRREGAALVVRGLDCLDGTPLLDIKPDRCAFTPANTNGPSS